MASAASLSVEIFGLFKRKDGISWWLTQMVAQRSKIYDETAAFLLNSVTDLIKSALFHVSSLLSERRALSV
jgi:hypothetical protein